MALIDDRSVNKVVCATVTLRQVRELDRQAKLLRVPQTYIHPHALEHGLLITQKLFGIPDAET